MQVFNTYNGSRWPHNVAFVAVYSYDGVRNKIPVVVWEGDMNEFYTVAWSKIRVM